VQYHPAHQLPGAGRWRDLGVGSARGIARNDRLDLDLAATAVDQPKLVGGGVGEVDDTVGVKRAAIGDADDDRFAGLDLVTRT
jgi:hypothetical protein